MSDAGQLTIGYSTLLETAGDIRPPDGAGAQAQPQVLVLVQGDGALEPDPSWDRVVRVPGHGVARSRNAAIEHATRRYLLFCDDDVEVNLPGVLDGIAHLKRTGAALALGRGTDAEGRVRKRYLTSRPGPLNRFSAAKAATYEMLVDLDQVRAAGVRFDTRFGAGAPLYLGDEYLFIVELLRRGLKAVSVPYIFGTHPDSSSGSRWGGKDLHVRAVVLNEVHGRAAPLVRAAFALRHARGMGDLATAWAFVTDGTRAAEAVGSAGEVSGPR